MRVLVVEDDVSLADVIARGLRTAALAVDACHDGDGALLRLDVNTYDVVVLDRDLPGTHGDEVCRRIAEYPGGPAVLMLTAAGSLDDRVNGLGLGADDYLVKPFAMEELIARVRALGRRADRSLSPVLEHRDLTLDPSRLRAARAGRDLRLSRKEFGVLEELLAADGAVVSNEALLERVWDELTDPFTNVVRVTVMTLRRKLGEPPLIETVTGSGYRVS